MYAQIGILNVYIYLISYYKLVEKVSAVVYVLPNVLLTQELTAWFQSTN